MYINTLHPPHPLSKHVLEQIGSKRFNIEVCLMFPVFHAKGEPFISSLSWALYIICFMYIQFILGFVYPMFYAYPVYLGFCISYISCISSLSWVLYILCFMYIQFILGFVYPTFHVYPVYLGFCISYVFKYSKCILGFVYRMFSLYPR